MKIGLLKLGDFLIRSFSLPHNVPNVGFLIRHPEIGVLLFVTDAAYIKQRFIGLNHILIEANYQEEYLVNDRAVGNHMSLEQTMRFMRSNAMSQVYNIVLLHLSSSNSNAKAFSKMISDTVPHANVYIADKGVNIELQKKPF
jgi:ribonuclease BN (tRNA processing enzyme)